jgi:hypothetical protein
LFILDVKIQYMFRPPDDCRLSDTQSKYFLSECTPYIRTKLSINCLFSIHMQTPANKFHC